MKKTKHELRLSENPKCVVHEFKKCSVSQELPLACSCFDGVWECVVLFSWRKHTDCRVILSLRMTLCKKTDNDRTKCPISLLSLQLSHTSRKLLFRLVLSVNGRFTGGEANVCCVFPSKHTPVLMPPHKIGTVQVSTPCPLPAKQPVSKHG